MGQEELISKRLNVSDEKPRDDQSLHVTGGGHPVTPRSEPTILGELEKLGGLNNTTVSEYVTFQTKIGVAIGYLIGSLFAAGGAIGIISSLAGAPGSYGSSPESAVWLPVVCCALGALTITNTNKLNRMLKVPEPANLVNRPF
jgi:hypothetical protein